MRDKTPRIALSRLSESEWERRGLRAFLEYRDLGIAEVTEGRAGATVARAADMPPKGASVAPRHVHDLGFHMIYVLKGWLRTEFEGVGEIVMHAGDCVAYEGKLPQTHIEYSDDYEVLQVTFPARFETVEVEAQTSRG